MARIRRHRRDTVQSPLETYLREINEMALLTADEEKELAHRIARGDKLTTDIKNRSWFFRTLLATMSRIFLLLFQLNLRDSPFGWQVVAVARKKPSDLPASDATQHQPSPTAI